MWFFFHVIWIWDYSCWINDEWFGFVLLFKGNIYFEQLRFFSFVWCVKDYKKPEKFDSYLNTLYITFYNMFRDMWALKLIHWTKLISIHRQTTSHYTECVERLSLFYSNVLTFHYFVNVFVCQILKKALW